MDLKERSQQDELRELIHFHLRDRFIFGKKDLVQYLIKNDLRVNGNIKSHELPEISISEAKLIGVVGTVIKTWIW